MIKKGSNHWSGILLLLIVISFLFYKIIFSSLPLDEMLYTTEETQNLQVQLHRDLLRYRNNKINQYDTLNNKINILNKNIRSLTNYKSIVTELKLVEITRLNDTIEQQANLLEDFKTHHSILKNSLLYIFNLSGDLYSMYLNSSSKDKLQLKAELITLLLEFKENPTPYNANKIYPLIDQLNIKPDRDTNALINHSLIILERIPEIDNTLEKFNELNIETTIVSIKNKLNESISEQSNKSHIFNILLLLFTGYLIAYIAYIFINLQKRKQEISNSNEKLSNEISLREKTEKALYQLVEIDKNGTNSDEDRILYLLSAICNALNVEYAYISQIQPSGTTAKILGLLDHGILKNNISYELKGTPCEEAIKNGRLVYNRDLSNYFPDCSLSILQKAESLIAISLTNKKNKLLGVLTIASTSPILDTNLSENILSIIKPRAVIELEHQIEINNNKRYELGLSLIDEWIARLVTEGYEKDIFFKNICFAAQEITRSQLATFPILNKETNTYYFHAATGRESRAFENVATSTDNEDFFSSTILQNKSRHISNLNSTISTTSIDFKKTNLNSVLLSPVTLKDKPYGAIAVFRTDQEFDHIDIRLLSQFSQSVQMAIMNMQLVSLIKSERERAEVTLHSIADAVITTNTDGKIEYMNNVAESLTAWTLDEAKNRKIQDIFRIKDIDTGEAIHEIIDTCLLDGISINKSILKLVSKNGNHKDIESSISPILNTSNKIEGIVIVFHDESQRRQLENTVKHQATHDALTDLLNRSAFDTDLSNHLYDVKNNNEKQHILCYLDLDRFKLINDTAGHNAGDQCLIQITALIQSCVRSEDILARLGGDEFGLILKNCTLDSALKITNNIVQSISNMKFNWEGCDYKLGVSIGIHELDESIKNTTEAIRRADLACYTAKDLGKSQVYVYKEKDCEIAQRHEEMLWANQVRNAIDYNRICLYAQPIISLNKEAPNEKHVEILVRLLDQDDQLMSPGEFMPAAERYNLMHLIDKKVIFETFSFISKNLSETKTTSHFSINLSVNTLSDHGLASYIKGLAEQFDIDPRTICFEIAEVAAIKNLKQTQSIIKNLSTIGFKFALDNFGSSFSSFQYLKSISVDYLKIDGGFVSDMVNNNIDRAMVSAINEVGHIMGIETIAEYAENDQIIKLLKDIKTDFAQGYGIAQPLPIEEVFSVDEKSQDKLTSPSLKVINNKP